MCIIFVICMPVMYISEILTETDGQTAINFHVSKIYIYSSTFKKKK